MHFTFSGWVWAPLVAQDVSKSLMCWGNERQDQTNRYLQVPSDLKYVSSSSIHLHLEGMGGITTKVASPDIEGLRDLTSPAARYRRCT